MQRFSRFFVSLLGFFVLVLVGCSNSDSRYTKVEGTVTYNQQPMEGANVTFLPVSAGENNEPAAGRTDAGGKFSLTSSKAVKGGSGILPGEYVVLVSKVVLPPDPDGEAFEQGTITYEELLDRRVKTAASREAAAKNVLPEKYSQRDKTDLKATVVSGKNSPFTFDLTD